MVFISLRNFGYRMENPKRQRRQALIRAISEKGLEAVIRKLERITENARYTDQTLRDLEFCRTYGTVYNLAKHMDDLVFVDEAGIVQCECMKVE